MSLPLRVLSSSKFDDPPADLKQARQWYQSRLPKGVRCPCCDRPGKVRRRNLTATMARALVLMYRHYVENPKASPWIHLSTYLAKECPGGDIVKLRYWGLIEPKSTDKSAIGAVAGYYRLTPLGQRFVEGKIPVPRSVWVYRGDLVRVAEQTVTIRESLGHHQGILKVLPFGRQQ